VTFTCGVIPTHYKHIRILFSHHPEEGTTSVRNTSVVTIDRIFSNLIRTLFTVSEG